MKAAKETWRNKRYEVEHGLQGKADKVTLNKWYETWINSMLNNIFELALNNDLIVKNPCTGVTMPTIIVKERRVLTSSEQEQLLNHVHKEKWSWYAPMLITLLGSVMRIGECLALTWNDIDFENKQISITKTLSYIKTKQSQNYEFKLQTPKNFPTKKAAEQHEAEMKVKLSNPTYTPIAASHGKMTVQEYMETWVEQHGKANLRPSTFASYKGYIKNYIVPNLGHVQLRELTPVMLAGLYGLRISEILGLRWQNVNLEKGIFSVIEQLPFKVPAGTTTLTEMAPVKSEERTLPITEEARPFFERKLATQTRQKELSELSGKPYYDNDLVVAKPDGAPLR